MTREDIDKLKGKLVSVENPYRSRPFIGLIYHVDGDTCYLIDSTQNRIQVKYQQTESMRETTGDEAITEMLADCKCGISDMNIEGNFIKSDE